MDLLPDDDQAAIAASFRDLVETTSSTARLRSLTDGEPVADPKLWQLAAQQGLFGLDLREEAGGAGLGLAEQTLVFRELGRGLVAGPYLGTLLATHCAAAAGDVALTAELLSGAAPVGLLESVTAEVWRTFDADDAKLYVHVDEAGSAVYPAASVQVYRRRPCVDAASRWAELRIVGEPLVRTAATAFDALPYACVLVAAMLSGICEAVRDQSAAYVKVRTQFGVPIGSFQAVKHRCADEVVRAEAATQLVTLAALALGDRRADASLLWPAARVIAADHAMRNCSDNIQNHGGIGYTSEHDAHLFLKRTQVLSDLLVSPAELRTAVLGAPELRPA